MTSGRPVGSADGIHRLGSTCAPHVAVGASPTASFLFNARNKACSQQETDALPPVDAPDKRIQQKLENFEAAVILSFAYHKIYKMHAASKQPGDAAGAKIASGALRSLSNRGE